MTKIKSWTIQDAPTKKDPDRRILLVKAPLMEVRSLVRRLGAVCSRPKKEKDDPKFNYSLYLHKVSAESLVEIETELKTIAGPSSVEPKPGEPAEEPAAPKPGKRSQGGGVKLELNKGSGTGAAAEASPAPIPADSSQERKFDLTPPPVSTETKPAAPAPPVLEMKPREIKPLEQQQLLGAIEPIESRFTLERLSVGIFNRFAHAAATSIVASPGNLYNPLFISGPAGSGKSHMLHAVAAQSQEQASRSSVWMTTGSRLAQAVALASQSNRMGELEAYAKGAKALLIDDFHLAAVSDQNQAGLAHIVKIFMDASKQIVLSSIYPAKLLSAIESAFQLRISGGHSVELKLPGESMRKEIVRENAVRMGFSETGTGFSTLTERILQDFSRMDLVLERLKILQQLNIRAGQQTELGALIALIFPPEVEPFVSTADELKAALTKTQPTPHGSVPTALFYPTLQEVHADWVWHQLHQTAQQNGWAFPFRRAARKFFEVEPVFSVPFLIAEECRKAGVSSALVLGAAPGTDLAGHESEFQYALRHLLAGLSVDLGWISFNRVKDPNAARLAFLDMCPAPEGGA